MPEPQKALIRQFEEEIDKATKGRAKRWTEVQKARKALEGIIEITDMEGKAHPQHQAATNLILSTVNGLLPYLYARKPEILGAPLNEDESSKATAKTLEQVVNQVLRDAGVRGVGKRVVRQCLTDAIGWTKVSYQRDDGTDTLSMRRIDSRRDQYEERERLLAKKDRDTERDPAIDQKLALLEQSLSSDVEPERAEGLVIDSLAWENVVFDDSLRSMADFEHGEWACQRLPMTMRQAEQLFGYEAISHTKSTEDGTPKENASSAETPKQVIVYEFWDRRTMTVYTWVKEGMRFARQPYQPQQLGERWYPFFPLVLQPLEHRLYPLSLVHALIPLQREYEETRERLRKHRDIAIPGWLANGSIKPSDVTRFVNAALGEVVLVDTEQPLDQVFRPIENPPINPAAYDTTAARIDLEMVSGLQDANRGGVVRSKTATEADLLQQGLVNRTNEQQEVVEQWFEGIARYVAELALQNMGIEQIIDMVEEAQPSWPALSRHEVFRYVSLSVRSGSAARANKQREQERWAELLPLLKESLMEIRQLEAAGVDTTPERALLEETLQRYDERIEIDKFLPPPQPQQQLPGVPGAPPGVDPALAGGGAPVVPIQQGLAPQGLPPELAGVVG